jgi:hypothetical protein
MWLLAAQLLAVGSGVWEGRGATIDVRRITVYASVPVLLVVWYMTQAAYATPTDVSMILQLIPSIGGTMILFSPSWVAIAVGVYIQRGLSSGMSAP